MSDWPAIAAAIGTATGHIFQFAGHHVTRGGYINQAFRIAGQDGRQFFLKLNAAQHYPVLLSEVAVILTIDATRTLRVPRVIVHGATATHSYLVLEYLELSAHGDARLLGEQLALMHRCTSEQFGFARDNHIGATRQPNAWTPDWITFLREQRLGFQLQLANKNNLGGRLQMLGDKLLDKLPAFFTSYTPIPSLLHGDLWSGNHGYLPDGTPAIFDPAAYYGDRECDLAMSELFGGFVADFYDSYNAHFPLEADYSRRRTLYNLYHILNHANMFGGSYVMQAEQMIQKLLSHCLNVPLLTG